jgi:hypothetical protein
VDIDSVVARSEFWNRSDVRLLPSRRKPLDVDFHKRFFKCTERGSSEHGATRMSAILAQNGGKRLEQLKPLLS